MPVPEPWGYRARPRRREARGAALLAALALAGCEIAVPLGGGDPPTTGSLGAERPIGLDPASEEWRRASAALAAALDPQGEAAEAAWESPIGRIRGAVAPASAPFVEGDLVCRRFVAWSQRAGQPRDSFAGYACRVAAGDWRIRAASPASTDATGELQTRNTPPT